MYMMEEGYERTKERLSAIFSEGIDNLEVVYERIGKINSLNSPKIIRLTGDVVVTNINNLLEKFVRKKRILEGGVCNE